MRIHMSKLDNLLFFRRKSVLDIKQYQRYLSPGTYRLTCIDVNRYAWKKCNGIIERFRIIETDKELGLKNRIRAWCISTTFRVKSSSKMSCGNRLYVSRQGNIKVFSEDNRYVYYFVNSDKLFSIAKHYNENYARFFGKSIIERLDSNSRRITERCVIEKNEWRTSVKEVKLAAIWVMRNMAKYLESINNNYKYIDTLGFADEVVNRCRNNDVSKFISELKNRIDPSISQIPFVYQHNDVVLSNILKETKDYTLFDYEFYAENIFFYDSFMWIFWEACLYHRDIFLSEYLNGLYDDVLSDLFAKVGMCFDKSRRCDYMRIFIIANINVHLATNATTNLCNYRRVADLLN